MMEMNKNEKYAVRFLNENGFKVEILKQYISKTILKVEKDGLTYSIELLDGIVDIKGT